MGLLDRFQSTESDDQSGYEALRVDADLADAFAAAQSVDRRAISVRPHKDNGGIEAMQDVLESIHSVETESPTFRSAATNVSSSHAFEMRYAAEDAIDERVATIQYVPGDGFEGTFRRQLQNQYSDSQIEWATPKFLSPQEGQYVAAATLGLRKYCLHPIKNVSLPGFRTDPTGSILEEMVGTQKADTADADVALQILFKPASRDWTQGVDGGPGIKDIAYNLRQPTYKRSRKVFTWETLEYPPSKVDKQVAKLLEEQQGEKGWRLCLHVFAISDDPSVAVTRASKAASQFRNFYESNSEQTFVPEPLTGEEIRDAVDNATRREWTDAGIVKSQLEVAGLVNIPEAQYVNTNKMRWSLSRPGEGIPPGTPRFDFAAHGVDGASRKEKQVAMLDTFDPDEAYWYGWGSRHGVEAGVRPEILNVHQFVGGGTGKGKTTYLTNLASQIMRRGHGALIFDPKGKDADEFIREWPDDRPEEDFVFVDLSDDYENQVRFNFLEIPTDAPPDSRTHATAVEALCDDLVAMIAQAGGDDNYWGALMNRVSRTLIRGMAKSDRTCTLLDLACCCTAPENRDRFQQWMSDERIHFIEEAAHRIADKEERDLEPLAGRLDQWIQNDAIRNLISARESTVSIQDAVEDGKVIVVRNAPSSGETEKRLFATALIRRAWVAIREAGDSPPFYVICDEFDSIVTKESSIHTILSEARAFDFCLTLACQNPSNQLPDRIAQAIANQCETFISFNPGGERDARLIESQHSPDVTWEDLSNLSKYKFFMRTHDDDHELTHSYKVDAFPPIRDVREDVTGTVGMTDDELDAFKRRSTERYGAPQQSPEEQKRESHFYSEGTTDDSDDSPGVDLTDDRRFAVLEAVFSERVATGDDRVDTDAIIETLDDEWPDVSYNHVDVLLQRTASNGLLDLSPDGATVGLTPEGRADLFGSGTAGTAGRIGHQAPMEFIARELSELGYRVSIPKQDGKERPDLVGRLPVETEVSLSKADAVREELQDEYAEIWALSGVRDVAVELEKATLDAPAQIGHNLRKAVETDRLCLYVVNEGDDEVTSVAERLARKLSEPMLVAEHTPDDADRKFHHDDAPLVVDGESVVLPGDVSYEWVDVDGAIHLRSEGETVASFADIDAWLKRSAEDLPTTDSDSPSGTTVFAPFIPEVEFEGDPPESDAWEIAILPSESEGTLRHYDAETGETRPLSSLGASGDVRVAADGDADSDDESAPTDDPWDDELFQ